MQECKIAKLLCIETTNGIGYKLYFKISKGPKEEKRHAKDTSGKERLISKRMLLQQYMENTHENTWKEKELFKHRSEFPRFYRAGGGDLSKFIIILYTYYICK